MTTHPPRHRRIGTAALAAPLALLLAAGLAACGTSADADGTEQGTPTNGATTITLAAHTGAPFVQKTVTVKEDATIRAELPAAIRKRGTLVVGVGALPAGFPPLVFTGTDQKTITGSEPDLARAVGAVLGLKVVVTNATWENLFVGIDSGRTDVGFSNITDTEERKKRYDFATYRQDNLGFEVLKSDTWNFDGDYRKLAGLTVAVSAGTNQEKLLQTWRSKLQAAGKTIDIKNFPDQNSVNLALASGRIDAWFGPNPGIQYHIAQVAKAGTPTRSAGTFSGAGSTLQGLIAATTKKGNGLIKPVLDALNQLIADGTYAEVLTAYNLGNEAVTTSLLNPPGLPVSNS